MKRSSVITWEQLRVGALMLAALAILAYAIYRLGQSANLFSSHYELVAFLPNANGLRPGGSVLVAGQFAGTIRSIDFLPVDEDTTRNLKIRMAIDAGLRDQIRTDSRARVHSLGLLGDRVIDISIGTPTHPALRAGDTLAVSPALDYDAVLAQVAGAVDDMVGLTRDLRSITGGLVQGRGTAGQLLTNRALYDQLVATLRRANVTLARFGSPQGTVGRMLDDPTLYDRLVGVVTSADSLVLALNDRNGTLGRLLRDDTLYTHMVNMAVVGDSLMRMIASGHGLAGRLLNDETLYDRLNKLTTDLGLVIGDVRKDPRRYLKGLVCIWNCR